MTEIVLLAIVKYGPAFGREIYAMFQKTNPTQADWEALFVKAEKSYEDYVRPIVPPPPA